MGRGSSFAEPVSPASVGGLVSRVATQVVGDASEVELVESLGAAQRVMGLMWSRLYLQIAELYARRTAPAKARLAAARAVAAQAVASAEVGSAARDVRVARQVAELAFDSVGDEVALELSWSRGRADRAVLVALALTGRLPRTLDALAAGKVEVKKAEVIATELDELADDELVATVEELVLPGAAGWNVPQLREQIKRAVLRVAPELAAERAATARAGRKVRFRAEPDDMVRLEALMSADEGIRLQTALDVVADAAMVPGDTRSADQRRVDCLVDVGERAAEEVLNRADDEGADDEGADDEGADDEGAAGAGSAGPVSSRGRRGRSARLRRALRHEIAVTVPLETITGDAQEPGYLARYGPISADLARRMALQVAAEGWWRCAVTDDTHGTLLGLGRSTFTPAYEAPVALQRFLNLRDRTCDFPGCRAPAVRSEVDHHVPYPAGATCECNGRKRCKHHHRLKHESPWKVEKSGDPADPPGTMIWTTPAGRSYGSVPPSIGVPSGAISGVPSGVDEPPAGRDCREPATRGRNGESRKSGSRKSDSRDSRHRRSASHDVWSCDPARDGCHHPVHAASAGPESVLPPF